MLKEKELMSIGQTRFRDGEGVTFEYLESQLAEAADNFAIPVAFGRDQIQSGGLLSKTSVDCLTMYHPNHVKDYNYYVFSISRQGKYAFVDVWSGGGSELAAAQYAKENLFKMGSLDSYGKGAVIGSLVRGAVKGTLFAGKSKHEEEKNWYTMVDDIIDDVLK